MTHDQHPRSPIQGESRSQYEYGDLTPALETVAAEERADHAQAPARGERLAALTTRILNGLMATGHVRGLDASSRPVVFDILADDIYPNQAIDIPELRTLGERTTP
jgi:hypothetical protein